MPRLDPRARTCPGHRDMSLQAAVYFRFMTLVIRLSPSYFVDAGLWGASGDFFPGALRSPRELFLTGSVDPDTRRPPTQVGSRDRFSNGFRGSALFHRVRPLNDLAIAARKSELRASLMAARKIFAAADGPAASLALAAKALELPELSASQAVVGGYWPIRGEVDPRPLLAVLAQRGLATALPLIVGDDLAFHRWAVGDRLVPAGLGTFGPEEAAPSIVPSILLVPLVGFDRRGHRLGYGRGFYDRVIARLAAAGPLVTIGLAYALQEAPEIPIEPHDRPLDLIATEREIFKVDGSSAGADD